MNDKNPKSLLDVAQDVRNEHQAELEKAKLQASASDAEAEQPEETLIASDPEDPNCQLDT